MIKLYKPDIEKVAGGMIEFAGETLAKNGTLYNYEVFDNETGEFVVWAFSKDKEKAQNVAQILDGRYHHRKTKYGIGFAKKVVKIDEDYDEWVDRYYIETHDDIYIEDNYTL